MKNIITHNLYKALHQQRNVDMIEDEIYIYETSEINTEDYRFPLKTDYVVCCICLKGELNGKIDMKEYHVQAPCLAISLPGQILEHGSYSGDFKGILIFMSRRFTDGVALLLEHSIFLTVMDTPYLMLTNATLKSILTYCDLVKKVIRMKENPHHLKTIRHLTVAYFYKIGFFLNQAVETTNKSREEMIVERFLQEVRNDFRKERRVGFYAGKLQLSANYLSHVVKKVTGKTADRWIDDYTVLEAKALLKSTDMTIQQIADELNFPSQSFFGKFFKRMTGVAPKYYRFPPQPAKGNIHTAVFIR
ncbi:MAG: helix-turn-helix domain-containing protein [Prevotella sp.]|jgi:AraC-like DNA-binding protein|nr:helix-turn-helix domain-containing protein [Prevotella sp.]